MKTNILTFLVLFLFQSNLFASPNETLYLNDAAVVAKVESFTTSGYLNCSLECFLDMKYVDLDKEPVIYFQVGTEENPGEFMSTALDIDYLNTLKIEKTYSNNSYKLKINFGKVKVKHGFKARLVILEDGQEKIIPLKSSNYKDDITQMNYIDKSLCKVDQFLKKIQFDRLYDVDYFESVVSSN